MDKYAEVVHFGDKEDGAVYTATPTFTRWSPDGVQRSPPTVSESACGAYSRWNEVLSDDVAVVREMEQKAKQRRAASMQTLSPISISTPNLAAMINEDAFALPKATLKMEATLMLDSLLDAPMTRAQAV